MSGKKPAKTGVNCGEKAREHRENRGKPGTTRGETARLLSGRNRSTAGHRSENTRKDGENWREDRVEAEEYAGEEADTERKRRDKHTNKRRERRETNGKKLLERRTQYAKLGEPEGIKITESGEERNDSSDRQQSKDRARRPEDSQRERKDSRGTRDNIDRGKDLAAEDL